MSARQSFYSDFLVPELRNKRSLLANMDFPGDIYRHMDPAASGLHNFEYRDPSTHAPASFMVFGEILANSRLNAIGNHFTGRPGETTNRINDNGKTHDVLKLGAPSNPTEELLILYDNQFVVFNNLYLDDCDFDLSRSVKATKIHECTEVTAPIESSGDPLNRLRIGLPKKFGRAKIVGPSIANRARPLLKKKLDDKKSTPVGSVSNPGPSLKNETEGKYLDVGGWYEPTMLPDYSSRFFNLVNDKLIQHNIRDIHGKLIPAWDNLDRLRPGTIVGIVGSLYAFNIENGESSYKRIYNLNAHSVQVLYESDEEAVTAQAETNAVIVSVPEKALDTSADFESLASKRKAITRQTEEQRVRETTPESPIDPIPESPRNTIPESPKDITLPESPLTDSEQMSSPIPSLIVDESTKEASAADSYSVLSAIDSDNFGDGESSEQAVKGKQGSNRGTKQSGSAKGIKRKAL